MPSRITLSPGFCICRDPECKIPYGKCHCGCGGDAIAGYTDKRLGWVKGKPKRFILCHHNKSTVERRLEKYKRVTLSGCWEWTGAYDEDGYGLMKIAGVMHRLPRVSYEMFIGPIPKGLIVLHSCDNPPCFNPAHLEVGTHKKNRQDAFDRGRVTSDAIKIACSKRSKNKSTETHCRRGHEYTPQNTYITATGARYCYACARLMRRLRRERSKGENRHSGIVAE